MTIYYHWMRFYGGSRDSRISAIDQLKTVFNPILFQTYECKNDSFDFMDVQFSTNTKVPADRSKGIFDYVSFPGGVCWYTLPLFVGGYVGFVSNYTDLAAFQKFLSDQNVFEEIPVLGVE